MFESEASIYSADMFIFLDETGTDQRNALRRYAYSWRGMPAVAHRLLVRGQRLSSIEIMNTAGVLDCHVVEGTVDGDIFYDFVQNHLLPHMMPFNGVNPHSVLVLDNVSNQLGLISTLERIQKLALRMCAKDWSASYEDLLVRFDLPTLKQRRKLLKLCFLYQVRSGSFFFPMHLYLLH